MSTNSTAKGFSTRLEIRGDNATIIREGLERKMKLDNRRTYTNTIEAILLEYFSQKKAKK